MKKDKYLAKEAKKYPNPIPSRNYILSLISRRKTLKKSKLIELLSLKPEQHKILSYRLKAMLRDKQLSINSDGSFTKFNPQSVLKGKIIANPRGFGFIELENQQADLRLNPSQMQLVFHNEEVLVKMAFDKKETQILTITKRIKIIIGRVIKSGKVYYLQADDKYIPHKILIDFKGKKPPKLDQMVVAKITKYPTKSQLTNVKIDKVLGNYFDVDVATKSALLRYSIDKKFKPTTISEAAALPTKVIAAEQTRRKDLTKLPFITIDSEDARDFDDAIYAQKDGQNYTLWVAIADVSHYIKPNSALDKEAKSRATSVYFPQLVVPMLPENISNGLCSLNPKVLRLCLCAQILINNKGEVINYQFYSAIIRSVARMTYTKVNQILVDKDQNSIKKYQNIYPHLLNLEMVYKCLSKAKDLRGAIAFNRPSNQIIFTGNGKIKKIVAKYSTLADRLVEVCMLLANETCAKFLHHHRQAFLYRVHPAPTAIKLQNLAQFLHALNINFPKNSASVEDFAILAKKTAKRGDVALIQVMVLRSLQQAVYTHNNEGHFGLALSHYTHFTSPIRRYPDLLVHRAIKQVLNKKQPSTKLNLTKLGKHCSNKERNADKASADMEKWLKCEFMNNNINKIYQGIISSVANFGLFVELTNLLIEGLIPVAKLNDDYYIFDPTTQSLKGQTTNKIYSLGDAITVRVADVSLHKRQIELSIA